MPVDPQCRLTMPPKRRKRGEKPPDAFDHDADTDWGHSDAKAALYAAIVEGEIPLKIPDAAQGEVEDEETLWEFFCIRPEVHNYGGFDKHFKRRLNACREQVQAGRSRAEIDQEAFDIFVKNHPKHSEAANGDYPEWEGHEAQRLLKIDMAAGLHKVMAPSELWEMDERSAYREFPLTVFRSHIYQEGRTEKFLKSLMAKRQGDKWKEFRNKEEGSDDDS